MTAASRLIIATPTDGNPNTATVSHGYHVAVRKLERAGAIVIPSEVCFADDLARARSRCVWYAQQRSDWDWILWWDDDVICKDTQIVPRMVERAQADGHHVLGAPYPRKRIPATFPYKPLEEHLSGGQLQVRNDCIEVDMLAFGFMLTSRECLDLMVEHYRGDLWFTDNHDPANLHETVAIFKQVLTPTRRLPDGRIVRELLGEDYSFCRRWRDMGGRVQMYVGEGSPLGHQGGHVYTGERAELGRIAELERGSVGQ